MVVQATTFYMVMEATTPIYLEEVMESTKYMMVAEDLILLSLKKIYLWMILNL